MKLTISLQKSILVKDEYVIRIKDEKHNISLAFYVKDIDIELTENDLDILERNLIIRAD